MTRFIPLTSLMIRVAVSERNSWREGVVVGGHAVDAGDGAERADVVVGAAVAHDADGADGEEDGEGLPDGVVEAVAADLVEIDGVGLAEDGELLAGDVAGAADGEAGAGEGVAADEGCRGGRARGRGRGPRP